GAAWVFSRSGGVWTQQGQKLVGGHAAGAAGQGLSVALSGDGNTALIGGAGDNSGVGATWGFVAAPTVTSVSPATGPLAGGTIVTINGTNFTGATSVRFATTPAASFTIQNAKMIAALTPKHVKGTVDVTVTTQVRAATKANAFTFR